MFKKTIWVLSYFLIFIFLLYNSYNYLDADLGWHLRTGEEISQELSVPHYEKHNYTLEGATWVDHEWLLNFISFFIYEKFSYFTLNIFFALIIIATLLVLNLITRKYYLKENHFSNKETLILILLSIFGVTAMSPHLGIRMQEITLLFIAFLLFILFDFNKTKSKKNLIFLIPLFYFWACVHAGFLIGFFIIGSFLFIKSLEKIIRKFTDLENLIKFTNPLAWKDIFYLCFVILLSFVATLVTPYGLELYSFLSEYSNTFYMKLIAEWLPAYYAPIQYRQLLYSAIFSTFFFIFIFDFYFNFKKNKSQEINLWTISLAFIFFALSFKSKRHFPLFFVISLPLLVAWINKFIKYPPGFFDLIKRSKIVKFYLIAGLVLSSAGFVARTNINQNPFDQKHYCNIFPCGAVQYLKENPELQQAKIFNSYDWGGYLIFTYPENKIFIDGRLPQYKFAEHTLLEEYLDFFDIEKTKEKLEKYGINLIVYRKQNKPKNNWFEEHVLLMKEKGKVDKEDFPQLLDESPEWKKVFEDNISIIWQKS